MNPLGIETINVREIEISWGHNLSGAKVLVIEARREHEKIPALAVPIEYARPLLALLEQQIELAERDEGARH